MKFFCFANYELCLTIAIDLILEAGSWSEGSKDSNGAAEAAGPGAAEAGSPVSEAEVPFDDGAANGALLTALCKHVVLHW